MITLAIEQSSAVGSLALLEEDTLIGEQEWDEERTRAQHLFHALPRLLEQAKLDPEQIDQIAVGLGPGRSSALRMAVAAARTFALPGAKPVIGIPSPDALAWPLLKADPDRTITVIGDARRSRLWFVELALEHGELATRQELRLIENDRLLEHLTPASMLVTPDWDRLEQTLLNLLDNTGTLVQKMTMPHARAVAELARIDSVRDKPRARRVTAPTDVLSPLYMHPPV